jgi:hypothetical protein
MRMNPLDPDPPGRRKRRRDGVSLFLLPRPALAAAPITRYGRYHAKPINEQNAHRSAARGSARDLASANVDHVYDGFHGFDSSGFFGPYVTPDFLKAELSEVEDVLGDLLGGARMGFSISRPSAQRASQRRNPDQSLCVISLNFASARERHLRVRHLSSAPAA